MSLVLVPCGEGLAIAHGANVPIDEEAASFDPIKRRSGVSSWHEADDIVAELFRQLLGAS
jgi:hypothetical protein